MAVLALIAAPQFALAATPLSFVNKVAAADLENLHDEEGGENAPRHFTP